MYGLKLPPIPYKFLIFGVVLACEFHDFQRVVRLKIWTSYQIMTQLPRTVCKQDILCLCTWFLFEEKNEYRGVKYHLKTKNRQCGHCVSRNLVFRQYNRGKGVSGGAKIFGSALLQPARSVCVSSERFFHTNLLLKHATTVAEILTAIRDIYHPDARPVLILHPKYQRSRLLRRVCTMHNSRHSQNSTFHLLGEVNWMTWKEWQPFFSRGSAPSSGGEA